MTLSPIDKQVFLKQLKKAEEYGDFSEKAVAEFYDWMYSHQDGYVQVCAFPVPTEDGWDIEGSVNNFGHCETKEEFIDFCDEHSGLWRYQVYAGVNALAEKPEVGRGQKRHIDRVRILTLDIETKRESYAGAPREHVWWSYQYALAQAKYIHTKYGVWPMVVMSENGIHLHYRVDFPVTDELVAGKQHRYSKWVTEQAMNNDYVEAIENKSPHDIEFSPDDVSDLPRVMKVPGTLGIKSDNGRLCGIIHKPMPADAGTISADQIDDDNVPDYDTNASKTTKKTVSLDPEPSELETDMKRRVAYLCADDELFRAFWDGKILTYDSRSDAEFAFVKKMLSLGLDQSEIQQVMSMSGMAKWDEEGDHYKEKTLARAIAEFDGETTKDRTNGTLSFRRV